MNISELFSLVDTLKPNSYGNSEKLMWLNQVEQQIADIQGETFTPYTESGDAELLAPVPFTNVYEYYLKAMIDNESKDFEGYSNNLILYNASFSSYTKHFLRNNAGTDTAVSNIW
jgi:hypothetical protein